MVQILSTVFLVSGLIAIFIGTIGVFGYSFKTVVTRRQAVTILFAGLFSLIIAGRFNLQTIPDINSQQSPLVPQENQSSTSTTLQNNQNNSSQPTQQNTQLKHYRAAPTNSPLRSVGMTRLS